MDTKTHRTIVSVVKALRAEADRLEKTLPKKPKASGKVKVTSFKAKPAKASPPEKVTGRKGKLSRGG